MLKNLRDLIGNKGILIDGDWIESKDQNIDGNVRLIQLADIGVNKFVDKSARFLTEEKATQLRCTFLRKNDILIARMPDPIGRACLFPLDQGQYVTVVDVCIFRPDLSQVDAKWLVRVLNTESVKKQIDKHISGTTRQRISRKNLETIEVDVPPLPIQRHIAHVLDQADQLRKQAQQMETELNALAQSVFLEMFGDPVTNPKQLPTTHLKKLVAIQSGGTPSKDNDHYWQGDIPWVSPKDMKKIVIDDSIDHISESAISETSLKLVPLESILIVIRGMILAHTVPLAISKKSLAINQDMKALTPIKTLDAYYLLYCLKAMHDFILKNTSTAAHGTKRLEMSFLESLDICIPSIELQQKFRKTIEAQTILILEAKNKKHDINRLFESLVQKAFKGELIPTRIEDAA